MDRYATSHFSNRALLLDLKASVAHERGSTAVVLSRIAEVDERKLYLREGYPSMHAFCVGELNYSEGAAFKRIGAARAARRFPLLLVALAEGRVHLSGVVILSKHLTSGNVDELLTAATHKTKAEIEQMIANRFPRPDLPERLQAISPPFPLSPGTVVAGASTGQPAPGMLGQLSPGTVDAATPSTGQLGPGPGDQLSPGTVEVSIPRSRVMPLAPQRFGLQLTLDQETNDLLQRARALMSHQNPTGELLPVLKSSLKLLVGHLEKRKFAATIRPRPSRRRGTAARNIPAAVKRAVWERDGGQCAHVSDTGKRCPARRMLEYDHIEPVARGGVATVAGIRLTCRAHNQYAAERTFGAEFMENKREAARQRAAETRARAAKAARAG